MKDRRQICFLAEMAEESPNIGVTIFLIVTERVVANSDLALPKNSRFCEGEGVTPIFFRLFFCFRYGTVFMTNDHKFRSKEGSNRKVLIHEES